MNIKTLVIFLVTLVVLSSCSETSEVSLVSEITGRVDSLKQVYAPDTRNALWNISMKNENGKLSVTAKVENKKAQSALLKLKTRFPTVNFSVTCLPESGAKTFALINNSVSNIRKAGRHSSELINQALLGTPVKILQKKGGWYLIQTPNHYLGWINQSGIVPFDTADLKKYETGKKIVFNRQCGFSYSKPDIASQVVSDLVIGCILPVIGNENGFYKVKYPDGRIAFIKKDQVIRLGTFFKKNPTGDALVKTALKFNGIPYLWGGLSSKAIDCSGFTSTIYFLNGIVLQRDASQQTKYGKEITTDFSYKKLQPGDLLFFGRKSNNSLAEKVTHVAMYIGNGKFIHSSGKVRISCMDSTKPGYAAEYAPRFVRAVRIIGQENGNTIQKVSENFLYKILKTE